MNEDLRNMGGEISIQEAAKEAEQYERERLERRLSKRVIKEVQDNG